MLTSQQLVDLFSSPRVGGAFSGKLEALRRFGADGGEDVFLRKLRDAQVKPARWVEYDDPTDNVSAPRRRDDRPGVVQPKSLTASDVAWLERLPRDPTAVSYSDARVLTGMVGQVEAGSSDARLLQSIWAPIRQFHARRAAEAELENTRNRIAPVIPESVAAGLLARAILAEVPDLTEDEASTRSFAALREAKRRVEDDAAAALDVATARVRALSGPFDAAELFESAAYLELARGAARGGDHSARTAIGEYDQALVDLRAASRPKDDAA